MEVSTQEYFVESLKPYMHELQVFLRDLDNHQNQYQLLPNQFEAKIDYLHKKEGRSDNLVTLKITIPARHEAVI